MTEDATPRLMYDVAAAARQLSLSRTTVFDLLRRRELMSVKVGARRLFAHADLVDFTNRLRNESGAGTTTSPAPLEEKAGATAIPNRP